LQEPAKLFTEAPDKEDGPDSEDDWALLAQVLYTRDEQMLKVERAIGGGKQPSFEQRNSGAMIKSISTRMTTTLCLGVEDSYQLPLCYYMVLDERLIMIITNCAEGTRKMKFTPASHNIAETALFWYRSYGTAFRHMIDQFHPAAGHTRSGRKTAAVFTSNPSMLPTWVVIPREFGIAPLVTPLLAAIESAKNVAGAYLTCPPTNVALMTFIGAVGMMFGQSTDGPQTWARHLIVNQFDVFWPQEMWEQAYNLEADVWMRCSPSDHFVALICLHGELKIKAAGLNPLPTITTGEVIIIPAHMYYAIGDIDSPMACTISLVF
jgi:hypothetical protein